MPLVIIFPNFWWPWTLSSIMEWLGVFVSLHVVKVYLTGLSFWWQWAPYSIIKWAEVFWSLHVVKVYL